MTADDRARQVVARVFARRERHRRRPLPVRVAVALGGFVLLALGAVLVVLPEAGLPVVMAALALLALEFDWAAQLLARAIRLAERIRQRFVSLPALTRVAVIAIPVLIVTAVVLVTRLGVSPV
jgi:putative transmembrane protein PGPGW